jgi:hypothetical protein
LILNFLFCLSSSIWMGVPMGSFSNMLALILIGDP